MTAPKRIRPAKKTAENQIVSREEMERPAIKTPRFEANTQHRE